MDHLEKVKAAEEGDDLTLAGLALELPRGLTICLNGITMNRTRLLLHAAKKTDPSETIHYVLMRNLAQELRPNETVMFRGKEMAPVDIYLYLIELKPTVFVYKLLSKYMKYSGEPDDAERYSLHAEELEREGPTEQ